MKHKGGVGIMAEGLTLLTIEDEEPIRRSIRTFFEDSGFDVLEAGEGLAGLAVFHEHKPNIVLVDLVMPGMGGFEVIKALAQEAPETPMVVLSGVGVIEDAINAIRLGAWDFVTKPIADMRQLLHVVNNVLERARLRQENRLYHDHLEEEVALRTRELGELNERLKRIVQSCRSITSAATLPLLTRQILEEFAASIHTQGGSIYLVEEGKLVLKYTLDPGHAIPCHALPLPQNSVFGKVLASRTSLLLEDIGKDESTLASGWTGYRDGSLLALPLFDSVGQPQGVLALHNKTHPPFTQHDREIGTVLASYSSEAIRAMLATEALRTSETTLRTFVNAVPEPALLIDREGRLILCNEALAGRFGKDIKELLGRNVFDLLPPEIAKNRRLHGQQVFRTGKPLRFEDSHEGRHYLSYVYPVLDPLGETNRVAAFAFDITDHKLAEKALKESEEKYRDLVENINDVVFSVGIDGRVSYISPFVETVLGYKPEEIIGCDYRQMFLPEDRPLLESRFKSVLEGETNSYEHRMFNKSGVFVWVRTTSRPVSKEGRVIGVQGSAREITARKKAELQLLKRAEELTTLNDLAREMGTTLSVESVISTALEHVAQAVKPDVAMLFLRDGERLTPGKTYSRTSLTVDVQSSHHRVGECLCGLAVKIARPVYSRDIHTDVRCTLEECKQAGLRSFAASPLISGGEIIGTLGVASASERDFEQQGTFLEALTNQIAVGLKNTLLYEQAQADALELRARLTQIQRTEQEKEKLMNQLLQSQKMEAIGTLARGIAHDFNNILTPIIMGAQMVLETLPEQHRSRSLTQKIVTAGERAKDLVSQILTFSRQNETERRPLALTPLVKEIVKLTRASLPVTIEIKQRLQCERDIILANPTQVHQVLMNLITNASHAMRGTGGILDIDLRDICLDEAAVADMPELGPGQFIRLRVRDTGHGMEPRTLEQIFDPFFTTKERDEGTGLGLAIVHGIVQSYNGAIRVESKAGEGTLFTIYLPSPPDMETDESEEITLLPRGTERILLVDDEAEIVDVVAQMLQYLGYHVEAGTDALKALAGFTKTPNDYDLVITDMTMPNLTGDKLALEIKRIRPDIPIILCSGYSDQLDLEKVEGRWVNAFLTKPIGANLATLIREVLSEPRTGQ
jgi:PAS domain S-box-containing protein